MSDPTAEAGVEYLLTGDLRTEDQHAQKDKRFHAEIAKIYDYVTIEPRQYPNELLFRPIDKHVRGGRLMLDLGCGTGHMFLRYAHLAERIIAVDHSREMLGVAAEKAKAAGLSKVDFLEQDLSEFLSLNQDLRADLVTCVGVLHHLEQDHLQALLAKIHALLVPGGQLVIAEPVYSSKVPKVVGQRNQKSILIKRLAECMPPSAVDPDEAPLHEEALIGAIREAGLKTCRISKGFELFHVGDPLTLREKLIIRAIYALYREGGDVIAVLLEK